MPEPTHPHTACPTSAQRPTLTRRRLAGLAGVSAVGVPLLAACGGGSTDAGSTGSSGSSGDSGGSGAASASTSAAAPSGTALASTSDIEVGSGKIFADAKVVVTQPTAGEFKAFTSTCTHQGCQVSKVEDGTIDCPCHGSEFSIVDGSVEQGPATRALPAIAITVSGDQITLT